MKETPLGPLRSPVIVRLTVLSVLPPEKVRSVSLVKAALPSLSCIAPAEPLAVEVVVDEANIFTHAEPVYTNMALELGPTSPAVAPPLLRPLGSKITL